MLIKKNIVIVVLIQLFILLSSISAEESIASLSGSIGNSIQYFEINKDGLFNKNNIINLTTPVDIILFGIKVNGSLFSDRFHFFAKARGEYNFSYDYAYMKNSKLINLGNNYFNIDEVYIDFENTFNYLLIGKERISWGNGFIWNPVDVLNPVKLKSISINDMEGVLQIKEQVIFDSFSFTLYYIPYITLERNSLEYLSTNLAAKMELNLSDIDTSLYYYQSIKNPDNISFPSLGFSTVYCISNIDLNLYCDFIYEQKSRNEYFNKDYIIGTKENCISVLGGISNYVQLENLNLSSRLEYFYNGNGADSQERENYINFLKDTYSVYESLPGSVSEEIKNSYIYMLQNAINMNRWYYFNQHYIGLSLGFMEIGNMLDISMTSIIPIFDYSMLLRFEIDLYIDRYKFSVFTNIFIGNAGAINEYGNEASRFFIGFVTSFLF